jgi:hypothetical protein
MCVACLGVQVGNRRTLTRALLPRRVSVRCKDCLGKSARVLHAILAASLDLMEVKAQAEGPMLRLAAMVRASAGSGADWARIAQTIRSAALADALRPVSHRPDCPALKVEVRSATPVFATVRARHKIGGQERQSLPAVRSVEASRMHVGMSQVVTELERLQGTQLRVTVSQGSDGLRNALAALDEAGVHVLRTSLQPCVAAPTRCPAAQHSGTDSGHGLMQLAGTQLLSQICATVCEADGAPCGEARCAELQLLLQRAAAAAASGAGCSGASAARPSAGWSARARSVSSTGTGSLASHPVSVPQARGGAAAAVPSSAASSETIEHQRERSVDITVQRGSQGPAVALTIQCADRAALAVDLLNAALNEGARVTRLHTQLQNEGLVQVQLEVSASEQPGRCGEQRLQALVQRLRTVAVRPLAIQVRIDPVEFAQPCFRCMLARCHGRAQFWDVLVVYCKCSIELLRVRYSGFRRTQAVLAERTISQADVQPSVQANERLGSKLLDVRVEAPRPALQPCRPHLAAGVLAALRSSGYSVVEASSETPCTGDTGAQSGSQVSEVLAAQLRAHDSGISSSEVRRTFCL